MQNEPEDIQNLSRRKFLGTVAGATAVASAPPGDFPSAPGKKAKEPFRGVFTIPSTPFVSDRCKTQPKHPE
jgi:hypothetical protein